MLFQLKSPLLGFETIHEMNLEKINDEDLFFTLSAKDNHPNFTLINPFAIRKDYEFEMPTNIELLLELDKDKSNILISCIMVVNTKDMRESSVNFLAPLVFNFVNKTMAQVILDPSKYAYGLTESLKDYLQNNTGEHK